MSLVNLFSVLRAALLNIFQDKDYNRSVLTIVGSLTDIGESIVSACTAAFSCIDLRDHEGGHPRLGAVDLIPIHPISPSVSLHDCANIAKGTIFAWILKFCVALLV